MYIYIRRAADVLVERDELAPRVEEPGRMQPACDRERHLLLAHSGRKPRDELRRDVSFALDGGGVDGDRLESALAAYAAGRRRVEAASQPFRVEARRVELDRVRGEVVYLLRAARTQSSDSAKAQGELLVVPGRAQRHGDGLACDADLGRLIDRDEV